MPTAVEHPGVSADIAKMLGDGSVKPAGGDLSHELIGLLMQVKLGSIGKVVITTAKSSLIGLLKGNDGKLSILIGLLLPAVQNQNSLTHALNLTGPYLAPGATLHIAGFSWGGGAPAGFTGGVFTGPGANFTVPAIY
jgi:hypothetical protein